VRTSSLSPVRAEAHLIEPGHRLAFAALQHNIPVKRALALHDFDAAIEPALIFAGKAVGFEAGFEFRHALPGEKLADLGLEGWCVGRWIGLTPLAEIDAASCGSFGRGRTALSRWRRERLPALDRKWRRAGIDRVVAASARGAGAQKRD